MHFVHFNKENEFYELDGVGDKCVIAGAAEDNRCIIFRSIS